MNKFKYLLFVLLCALLPLEMLAANVTNKFDYVKVTSGLVLTQGTPAANKVWIGADSNGGGLWQLLDLTASVSGILPVPNGGTGSATLTANRLLVGNGTSAVGVLAAGTSTTLLHGNASGLPTYSAVSLTADVTGVLPVANYATGTPTGAKFVRDDGVLAVPASGGGDVFAASNNTFTASNNFQNVVVAKNVDLPVTISTGLAGILSINGTRFLHSYGASNIWLGMGAGNLGLTTANLNIGIGDFAVSNLVTGVGNIVVGHRAMYQPTTAVSRNVILGNLAGYGITGNDNVIIGDGCGASVVDNSVIIGSTAHNGTGGRYNISIGNGTASSGATQVGTTCIGYLAGSGAGHYYSTIIGDQACISSLDSITNVIALGQYTSVRTPNTCVIGSVTATESVSMCLGTNNDMSMPRGSFIMNGSLGGVITNCTAMHASTQVSSVNLTANGNSTFGDASGDTVTFNAATAAIPNDQNIGSNTIFIKNGQGLGVGVAAMSSTGNKFQVATPVTAVSSATSIFAAGASNQVPMHIQAAAGQVSNLWEVSQSNGGLYFTISSSGRFNILSSGFSCASTTAGSSFGGNAVNGQVLTINQGVAAQTNLVIKAAASPTGPLTLWADSSGNTIDAINNIGALTIGAQTNGTLLVIGTNSALRQSISIANGRAIFGYDLNGADIFATTTKDITLRANGVASGSEHIKINGSNDTIKLGTNGTFFSTLVGTNHVVDPPSIAAGATFITNVTLTGATAGSALFAGSTDYTDPVLVTGRCTNNNNVLVIFYNGNTVSPVDPPSQTIRIRVMNP